MPCAIAILYYRHCKHSHMWKVGCTAGCDSLCPPSEQHAFIITHFLWSCEDCHERASMKAGDERCLAWAAQAREIAASNPLESRELLLTGMRARERQDERWADKVSSEKAEEIQWVADWTFDMAALAWEFLIAQERNPRSTMARIDKLRDMRLWDMVVVRDVLRDHDTLLEEQCELSPWILPGDRSFKGNKGKGKHVWKMPAPYKPVPPLFVDKMKPRKPSKRTPWGQQRKKLTPYENGSVLDIDKDVDMDRDENQEEYEEDNKGGKVVEQGTKLKHTTPRAPDSSFIPRSFRRELTLHPRNVQDTAIKVDQRDDQERHKGPSRDEKGKGTATLPSNADMMDIEMKMMLAMRRTLQGQGEDENVVEKGEQRREG